MLGDYKLIASEVDVSGAQWKRIQEWLIHPQVEEIRHRNDFTKQEFIEFCSARFEVIKNKLLSQLGY